MKAGRRADEQRRAEPLSSAVRRRPTVVWLSFSARPAPDSALPARSRAQSGDHPNPREFSAYLHRYLCDLTDCTHLAAHSQSGNSALGGRTTKGQEDSVLGMIRKLTGGLVGLAMMGVPATANATLVTFEYANAIDFCRVWRRDERPLALRWTFDDGLTDSDATSTGGFWQGRSPAPFRWGLPRHRSAASQPVQLGCSMAACRTAIPWHS